MTLGLFNGTGKRHNDPTLEGVKGLWVSRRMWWDYFTYELTSGQQTGRINGYSAFLPKWVRLAGQSARAVWEERRQDAPFRVWDESVTLTSNFLNAERADLWERLASCPDLMVLLCDANGRFWLIGEDVGLRTTWSGKTSNVQGYEVEITGQQRWATREVEGTTAVMMIQSDPTSVSPEYVTRIDAADLEYLNIDSGECVVLGPTPLTFCCNGGGGGITEAEVQALIDAALANLSAADIVFTPTGGITATNVQAAIAQADAATSAIIPRIDQMGMPIATNIVELDGVNDEFTWARASAALPAEFTVTGWIKLASPGGNRFLFSTNVSGVGADQIVVASSVSGSGVAWIIARYTAAGVLIGGITASSPGDQTFIGPNGLGEWVHFAAYVKTTATTAAEIWVNGHLYGRAGGAFASPTNYGANAGLFFAPGASARVNGFASNFTFHPRRLTRDEILSLARRGRAFALPTGATAHWTFDGSLTADATGNGNTLTALGGVGLVTMH